MAKCAVCGKSQSNGNKLSITRSHISKRSPRTWKPNLRSVKAIMENGETKRVHVCAKCLKDGKIKKNKYFLKIIKKTLQNRKNMV